MVRGLHQQPRSRSCISEFFGRVLPLPIYGNTCFLLTTLLLQNSCAFCPLFSDVNFGVMNSFRRCTAPRHCGYRALEVPKRYRRNSHLSFQFLLAKEIQYFAGNDFEIDWENPVAKGNFGSVYYGKIRKTGQMCAIKCPNLEEFSLRCYHTEVCQFAAFRSCRSLSHIIQQHVNIKLSKDYDASSAPWPEMLGVVNIPGRMPSSFRSSPCSDASTRREHSDDRGRRPRRHRLAQRAGRFARS